MRRSELQSHRFSLGVLAAVAALPLIQLIPLPPELWSGIPGRTEPALALELGRVQPGWLPLSLTPERTWRAFLALLPPAAIFLAILAIDDRGRVMLVLTLMGAVVLSLVLGAAQLASGGDDLYPWRTTDAGNVVGFFANRNHLATLCLISLPFAAVFGVAGIAQGADKARLWYAALFIGLVVVAIGVIRSRAGILLTAPVLGASLITAWYAAGRGQPSRLLLTIAISATVALLAVAVFALDPIVARFDTGAASEGRFENWPVVAQAANTYLPLGSGLGSFDSVYRSVEPLERLDPTYFNQAHNEYLELWLEAGWFGVAVLIGFLTWFGRRSVTAWSAAPSVRRNLQRAASVAIGAVLLHSIVDYPMRTETIAVAFAICCGLLELASRSDAGPASRRRSDPAAG